MKAQNQEKKIVQPLKQIERIQQKRQERRFKMQEAKKEKQEKRAYNLASGKNVDIDFQIMIQKNMFRQKMLAPHISGADLKLAVCVRKRPIFKKQEANGEIDSISCANPQIKIHEPKYRVDGITKYVEDHKFTFDNTFNEEEGTEQIYQFSLKPLIPLLMNNGIVTCFAYGQTGSGKTFTMNALQELIVKELFSYKNGSKLSTQVCVSFFEIYGGRCLDLLNNKQALNILQDQNNSIQIPGLSEQIASSAAQLLKIMQIANTARTTHATAANDTSSRSHAICQVLIKQKGSQKQMGKLVLVDLAGSQRAGDTQSNNRQRRMQGAQINKSLLALKECIRAMDQKADHVPFRASKLTLILRDSFLGKRDKSKIVMIACISPGSSSADHSLNTLRYADRLKDNSQVSKKYAHFDPRENNSMEKHKENFDREVQQRIASQKNIGNVKKQQVSLRNDSTPLKNANGGIKTPRNNDKSVPKLPPSQNNSQVQNVQPEKSKIPSNLPKSLKSESTPNHISSKIQKSKSSAQKSKHQLQKTRVRKHKDHLQKSRIIKASTSNQFCYQKPRINDQNYIDEQIEGQSNRNKQKLEDKVLKINLQDCEEGQTERVQKVQKKVKDDYDAMKQTMNNLENKEQMLAFTAKVTNIYEEQEQIFATHMAAIKQDAKMLTQESQLISMIQGVGFIDYDIDSYVQKLQLIMRKKMRIYGLLTKKVQKFKNSLKQEQEMRHNIN